MPNIFLPEYPEEYIRGIVTFFGREFVVSPDVLIPRLETEMLVRRARRLMTIASFDVVIDIGAGSGIIGTSLADLTDHIVFLDISPEALRVAEQNFRTHFLEKKAEFIVSDLLDKLSFRRDSHILFLANLPYIKAGDWEHMSPDTRYEPEIALFGGQETGFEIYTRLFDAIQDRGIRGALVIEFGFDQRDIAEEAIKKYGWKYNFFADYAGIERFCEIQVGK